METCGTFRDEHICFSF